MRHFTSVHDLENLDEALKLAFELKKSPYKYQDLGKNKTLLLVFFQLKSSHAFKHTKSRIKPGNERDCFRH